MMWLMMATALGASMAAQTQVLQVWTVDPLTKVFKDDAAGVIDKTPLDVARGEVVTWQVVVRATGPLSDFKATVGQLKPGTRTPKIRYVGYVPVDKGMQEPSKDRLKTPPYDFPDPLLEEAPNNVAANTNQPLWIDLAVPKDAQPGIYQAEVKVTGKLNGQTVTARVPISMNVHPVTVGKSRLWVTNWFFTTTGHMPGSNKFGTSEEEPYLMQLGKSLAAHRQNVALINTLELAKCSWDKDGKLVVDFSRFDKWVDILSKAGITGRIEGGHLGARASEDWSSQFNINIRVNDKGNPVAKAVEPTSKEADEFYSQYLPLLVKHLKDKRWWSKYSQHLADEPIAANAKSYKAMAALVHKYAPGLKIIEATHTKDVEGCIDIWVPQLNFAHTNYDYYKKRQKAGEEFWTYTCVWPEGEYANRFIELPLIKTRILHWLNYRYGITGYLHWGFNYWVKGDPFDDVTRTKASDGWGGFLPAGDSWLVYPKDGKLLDSIRYECMRDGIADYELLSMLGAKNPAKAQKLAEKIVLAFDKYNTDPAAFRTVRRELLEALGR